MHRSDARYEQSGDRRHLQHIVDRGERPVVLGGEDEVDDEDRGECEGNAQQEYLYR